MSMHSSWASVPETFLHFPASLTYVGHALSLSLVYYAIRAMLNSRKVEMLFRLCVIEVHSSPRLSYLKSKEALPKRCFTGDLTRASSCTAGQSWLFSLAPSATAAVSPSPPAYWVEWRQQSHLHGCRSSRPLLSQDALPHGPPCWVAPFSAELTLPPSPKTLCCSCAWCINFWPCLGYCLAGDLRDPAAASSANFGWSVRPELWVFLLKQLVKVSSYPGVGYDHVALEPFWKLLVCLYLAALVHLTLKGPVKPVSPGPAIESHHRLFFLSTKKSSLAPICLSKPATKSWDMMAPSAPDGLGFLCECGLWWS